MRIPHYGDNGIDTGNSSEKGLPQAGLTPRLKSPCMQTYKQTNKWKPSVIMLGGKNKRNWYIQKCEYEIPCFVWGHWKYK